MPMSSDPRAAAETTASAAGIAEHLSKVTGELERLRTALDTKLAKLEAALENPDTCPSLEPPVAALARVATREADATATRASLEARLVVEDHVAAQRGAESDRAAVGALRADLDAARTALDSERAASATLRHDVEELRTAVQTERAAERALRQAVEAAEQRVFVVETIKARELSELRDQLDLEHAAEHESNRAEVTRLETAMEALQLQLAAAREASHSQNGDVDGWQRRLEAADHRLGELEQLLATATDAANQQAAALDALQAKLVAAQQDAGERERRHQEQVAGITEAARAEVAAVNAELETIRATATGATELVAQLAASDAERARMEGALRDSESNVQALVGERDRLQAEVAELRSSSAAALDAAERRFDELCESTGSRIRDLKRKVVAARAALAAVADADNDAEGVEEELGAELWDDADQAIDIGAVPADAPSPLIPPARRTERHPISGDIEIQVDDVPATLVDLSVNGAQILSSTALKPNRAVALLLPVGGRSVLCKGKVVWARLEASSETLRYRGGIFFTHVDQRAIEMFLSGGTSSLPVAAAPDAGAEVGQTLSEDTDRERHVPPPQAAVSGR